MTSIVYVPGFMQRGSAWEPVASRLAERYPPVLLDHSSYELEGRLDEIRAAAPEGSVLCGYSLGGRLALHAVLRDADRYAGLVMLGAGAGVEDRDARRAADSELADWMENSSIEEVVSRWESLPVFASQSAELVASQRPDRLSFQPADLARLLRSCGQGAMPPVWHQLPDVPLLALAGELDHRYVSAARRLERLAPNATCRVVEGAGHAAHLERPDLVAGALEQLSVL